MARLIHVGAGVLAAQRDAIRPPPDVGSIKASRAMRPGGIEPWFELTPRHPLVDTRVRENIEGVAALLETFGGITGPAVAADGHDPDTLVLGGNPVTAGTPAPDDLSAFERQCTARIAVAAQSLGRPRECLVIVGVGARSPDRRSRVQAFVGRELVGEDVVYNEDRVAALFELMAEDIVFELRLRLAGDRDALLAIRGAEAFLL